MAEVRYATYTVAPSVLRTFWLAMVVGTIGLLFQVLSDEAWDGGTKFWVIVSFFAILAVLIAWVYRSATVTTPAHVVVRGLLRTRRIPWSHVQAIAIEINPGSFAKSSAPKQVVVVYDGTGGRITLPHLNDKTFAKQYGSVESEVDAMRAVWLQGRGDDWVPVAQAQGKAAERARYGVSPWIFGLGWASLSLPVVVVVFAIGLIGDVAAPWPFYNLFRPEAILVIPIIVFFATSIGSIIARRRARAVRTP